MSERVSKVRAPALVFDYTIYPRHRIDEYQVRQMAESLRAGKSLPPILVEKKTKRVVDGFHRVEAYRRVHGVEATIPAILKEWESEASMLLEAVEANATHGRSLTPQDKARCIGLLEESGLEPEQIASALSMTRERVEEMKVGRLASYKMEPLALKRTAAHLAGQELTDKQAQYNVKAGGLNQTFYINQVIAMLESNTVDWNRESVVNALRRLYGLLEDALKVKV